MTTLMPDFLIIHSAVLHHDPAKNVLIFRKVFLDKGIKRIEVIWIIFMRIMNIKRDKKINIPLRSFMGIIIISKNDEPF